MGWGPQSAVLLLSVTMQDTLPQVSRVVCPDPFLHLAGRTCLGSLILGTPCPRRANP